ncbi:MAG: SMI1/KNR4 family protein [Anaerotignum sp.]|nr:SMI1/KNR4 family protein [Anaerotignum sp.]
MWNIPENLTIEKNLKKLLKLSELAKEAGYNVNIASPNTDVEMNEWEKRNDVKIPEQYRDFLLFTSHYNLHFEMIHMYFPLEVSKRPSYISEEMVLIGSTMGGEETICFSKSTGNIVTIRDGRNQEHGDFNSYLKKACKVVGRCTELTMKEIKEFIESD